MEEKQKQEIKDKEELIESIFSLYRQGCSKTATIKKAGNRYNLAEEIYKGLNDPNSPYYEPDTYAYIQIKKEEEKKKYRDGLKSLPSAKLENSVFATFSEKKRKEIILMALTFRLSYKTLAAMFGTTIEDVVVSLEGILGTEHAMKYLNIETINESNRFEILAYRKAKKYWDERERLLSAIKETKKATDTFKEQLKETIQFIDNDNVKEKIIKKANESMEDIINTLKTELKEHRKQIDDSIVKETINKKVNELTDEEKNFVARYRPKYASTSRQCAAVLHFSRESIQKLEEELAEKDSIFKEQLDRLNSYWYNERTEYYDNTIYEEQIPQFGREGGTR